MRELRGIEDEAAGAAAQQGLCLVDARDRVLMADATFGAVAGFGAADLNGLQLWQLFAASPSETRRLHAAARSGATVERALYVHGEGAQRVECALRLSSVDLPGGPGVLLVLLDARAQRPSGVTPVAAPRSEPPGPSIPSEQLEALVQASPVPILAVDDEGRGLLWSAAAERLFGFRAHEVIGRRLPIVPQDKAQELEQLTYRARTQQHVVNLVTERVTKDGRRIPVSVSTGPLRAADGRVVGNVAVLVDLTDQRALQRALEDSERRFTELFDASPVASVLYRLSDMRVVEVNRAFLEVARLQRSDLVGLQPASVSQDFGPDAQERMRLGQALQAGEPLRDLAYSFRWRDGEQREGLGNIQPIEIAGERYALFVTSDITERTRVERALRESNERFRQLAETIGEVFWLSQPERRELIYISPAFARIFGRSCEELYANPGIWLETIHPDDRARVQAIFNGPSDWEGDVEYRVVHPDGALRWIRSHAYPVRDEHGRVVRIAGAAQDITERRALEAQLQQTQRLESIGLLAGGIAHDFNNLLTVILGSCDVLRTLLAAGSEGEEIVEEIQCAGERAAGLTRQLLAFSRRSVMEPRIVDLNEVVQETERLLRRILGEDVTLTTALPQEPVRVRVDPGAFGQLLMNLAVNARDAMPRGGSLRIALKRTSLGPEARARPPLEPGPHAQLLVSDDGVGMDKDVLAHIFEPFFTTKEPGRGTGLGLSVVHGIVAQHGGHIEVASTPGRGTTFSIQLPLVAASVEDPRDAELGVVAGNERILLVEDDAAIRRVASRVLQRLGYTVHVAANGREALAQLGAQPPDLVITDVVMPEMSGRELAELLRERAPAARLLYTSGYTDDAVLRHGIQHAEVAFLRKPYTPIQLARKIRELFD